MFQYYLFDLDGTLLGLDLEIFVPKYFQLLEEELPSYPGLKERVLEATAAMKKNNGQKTNEEVFLEVFFHDGEEKREELMEQFALFYQEAFPSLERTAKRLPLARAIVSLLLEKKKSVVIATNPIFPKEAIAERMRWAGIHDLPFSLVSSFENMSYCKPNLGYYREILDRIGGQANEALMVGNDVREDMVARELGITTYLVTGYSIHRRDDAHTPDCTGSLSDLYKHCKGHL